MHPNQGVANLYAWIVWEGRMIYRRLIIDQPLPKGDLTNGAIGPAAMRTIKPLMEFDVSLEVEGMSLKFRWTNFHWPKALSLNVGGASLAAGHYDMMGSLTGRLTVGGETFEVGGSGFMDHSWGVRRKHLPSSRSYFCVFDSEFYLMAIPVLSEAGERRVLGYVQADGKLGRLGTDSRLGYSIRDDWVTVAGCDSYFYDEFDRGFHITGHTIGPSSTQTMGHGKLVHHAVAEFECGGRMGRGILETAHPKVMHPDRIAELGVPSDSWWLTESKA